MGEGAAQGEGWGWGEGLPAGAVPVEEAKEHFQVAFALELHAHLSHRLFEFRHVQGLAAAVVHYLRGRVSERVRERVRERERERERE